MAQRSADEDALRLFRHPEEERRDTDGSDMTIQAFRRNLFRRYSASFSDDIAVAVLKIQPLPSEKATSAKGEEHG